MASPGLEQLPPAPDGKTGWPWTCSGSRSSARAVPSETLPRISIVTPSYNQGPYIEETIRSILLQNYPNLEYCVMDGGSTDKTVEVIKRYEPWLDYWCSEPDGGQAQAVNKGFARATGIILNWVNSDDILFPGALHAIAEAAKSRLSDRAIYFGNRIRCDAAGTQIGFDLPGKYINRFRFLTGSHIPQETAFISRSVYETLGPLTQDCKFALDYDYWVRASLKKIEFRHVNRFIGAMRFHSHSKSCSWQDIGAKETNEIRDRLMAELGLSGTVLRKAVKICGALEYKFTHCMRKPLFRCIHSLPTTIHQIEL